MSKLLDEKGFVFIANNQGVTLAYWCRIWNDEPWFFYWNEGSKGWVSLRRVNQSDIWFANNQSIPEEQAKIYHDLHNKNFGGGAPIIELKEESK